MASCFSSLWNSCALLFQGIRCVADSHLAQENILVQGLRNYSRLKSKSQSETGKYDQMMPMEQLCVLFKTSGLPLAICHR